jgi:hypothetical protein
MAHDFQTKNVVFTLPRDPAKVALIDKSLGLVSYFLLYFNKKKSKYHYSNNFHE